MRKQSSLVLLAHVVVICSGGDLCPRNVEVLLLKNWVSTDVEKQENIMVAARKDSAADKEHHKTYYNMASSFYRWCDPDDAEGENCKKNAAATGFDSDFRSTILQTYNADGYCEGVRNEHRPKWLKFGGTFESLKEEPELDLGEADALNAAMVKQAFGCKTKDHPPRESGHADGDWLDYLDDGMAVRRHELPRENVLVLEGDVPSGFSDSGKDIVQEKMTSIVYPVPVSIWLPGYMEGNDMYWIDCKSAMDPTKFVQADIMKYLNDTLRLWPGSTCNDNDIKLSAERGSGHIMIIILVLLIVIGLSVFGYLLYRRLQEDQGRTGASDARQVEMSAAINKPDADVENAPLAKQLAKQGSHKW